MSNVSGKMGSKQISAAATWVIVITMRKHITVTQAAALGFLGRKSIFACK